jgi:hypothetical protein
VYFKNFKLTNWRKSGMQKASDNLFLAGKLFAVGLAAVLATGCISAKSPPTDEAAAAEPAAPVEEAAAAAASAPAAAAGELTSWTVVDGNHLWGISAMEEVYNIPEKWPLIYKSNLDQIEDADLIYPGQVLAIPRGSSQGEVDAAINHAKTRGAWAVGPIEASDQEYLKNSG